MFADSATTEFSHGSDNFRQLLQRLQQFNCRELLGSYLISNVHILHISQFYCPNCIVFQLVHQNIYLHMEG
ncbi:hypothetical protein, partial [Vibrio anguillarum]|uniref:hypothetical protein n=1 Tax=Vibrio anguillarum TaxID=55601 RepID=UPI001F283C4B